MPLLPDRIGRRQPPAELRAQVHWLADPEMMHVIMGRQGINLVKTGPLMPSRQHEMPDQMGGPDHDGGK